MLAPAIEHAANGFAVNAAYLSAVDWVRSVRARHARLQPMSQWVWDHLCGGGTIAVGDIVRQPGQAEVLREHLDARLRGDEHILRIACMVAARRVRRRV